MAWTVFPFVPHYKTAANAGVRQLHSKEEFKMKEGLDVVDSAIKRLVTPISIFVAAAIFFNAYGKENVSFYSNTFILIILGVWIAGYMILSIKVAFDDFEKIKIGNIRKAFLGATFILVYGILFMVGAKLGIDKLPNKQIQPTANASVD